MIKLKRIIRKRTRFSLVKVAAFTATHYVADNVEDQPEKNYDCDRAPIKSAYQEIRRYFYEKISIHFSEAILEIMEDPGKIYETQMPQLIV